ncbi:TRAP transporter small permease [uncultured Cloacibacillus sp.]|uniref:TRAP transporter small permease n=1 Tax=uncultured Cloacibacillus sp. TaxID=889794 RepID=UPI0034C6A167
MWHILSAIDNKLKVIYDYIMLIAGSAVVLLIMIAAFLRYVLKINFHGSEEIILLFGYWLYFIGSISAARASTHLSAEMVNIFTKNPKIINVCIVIRDFVSLIICLLAIKWCGEYWSWSLRLKPVTSVHRIPYYLQQFPMCLSFLFWGMYLIRDCYRSVMHFRSKR